MLNPGDYSLCDLAVTTALNAVAQTPIKNLEGILAATIEAKLSYGSGGTSIRAWVQVTLDDGATWIDIACFAFTTSSGVKVVNLSGLTPATTAITPSDGAMADNTVQDGVLGSAMRVKLTSTGTYANTTMSVKVSTR
ncbi:hypothetical protein [Aminobacter sp. Piv2-1]|uniref:hypothetical protein n=1 Tax=Aminobacter sp. Piv2-1 TaxID=3031122 RepID=UPI00309541A1